MGVEFEPKLTIIDLENSLAILALEQFNMFYNLANRWKKQGDNDSIADVVNEFIKVVDASTKKINKAKEDFLQIPLLPCPFCESAASLDTEHNTVACSACLCQMKASTTSDVILAWNNRKDAWHIEEYQEGLNSVKKAVQLINMEILIASGKSLDAFTNTLPALAEIKEDLAQQDIKEINNVLNSLDISHTHIRGLIKDLEKIDNNGGTL